MRSLSAFFAISFLVVVVGCAPKDEASNSGGSTPATSPENKVELTKSNIKYADVQKIFSEKCVGCHGPDKPKAGINFTSYESVMSGSGIGPVVKPGDATGSLLVSVLHGMDGKPLMPPKNPLSAEQIRLIEDWIIAGAKNES
jgi:mono/diheme cytochrome c family protein